MDTPILTTVKTEGVTVFARFVAFVAAFVSSLMGIGLLTAEHGDKILGFMNSPKTAAAVGLAGLLLTTFLPAIQGWRSKDKELPPGVTIRDLPGIDKY